MSINWSQFDANGNGLLTQYSQPSNLGSSSQDGNQAAQLNSVSIQTGGQVVAVYSNGQQKIEGQLALAAIQNPTSLENVGNNNFSVSTSTATPAIGAAQSGGRGQILGGSLESSNVDMATQFTNLIVYQSAYQASSRVISTANNIDQDLMQLIH
jgi:flagellar hook protein FlgE